MTTAEILKQLRTNKNLRQADVAQMLGISQPAYQKYELGNAEPNGANYIKLADFYGVTTDYLLGREPQKDPFADLNLCKEDEQAVIDKYMSLPPDVRAVLLDVLRQLGGEITQEEIDEIALGNRDDTEPKGDTDLTA